MTNPLPFFGRSTELALLQQRWHASTTGLGPNIITLVGETGVGKSRIVQQFYQQLTIDPQWDPHHFWPDTFQTHATQLRVNPEFPVDTLPTGAPRFLWLGVRWSSTNERNISNSVALPTLKEQLTAIADQAKRTHPRPQRIIEAVKNDVVTIAKEMMSGQVEDMIDGVISSFVPYYKLITTVFQLATETRTVLGLTNTPPTLTEQLTTFFSGWFTQKQPIPMVIWLDDVQWIDAEATRFFAQLINTAYEQQWPLLVVATCWPTEWQAFTDSFFLKPNILNTGSAWPWVVVHKLGDAEPAQLRALITTAFPTLPEDQVALLITRAGGNFLTMIENITELQSKPRYFVDANPQNPLSEVGIARIHTWQSQRQIRIAQRFNEELDNDIQEFLARASQAGIDTQFLRDVLIRFASTHPHVGDIAATLQRCQDNLALIAPLSANLQEFRDRGYMQVARIYFNDWLAASESTALQHALTAELQARIEHQFDEFGELHVTAPITPPTSSREQYAILQLAQQQFGTDSVLAIRTLVIFCTYCITQGAWHALPQVAPAIDQIDWTHHAGRSIGWGAVRTVAHACFLAGMTAATQLYQCLIDDQQHQYHHNPTTTNALTYSEILRLAGKNAYQHSDYLHAQQYFTQALALLTAHPAVADMQAQTRLIAVTLHDLGLIAQANADFTVAETSLHQALIQARHIKQTEAQVANDCLYSSILNTLGQFALARGNWDEAYTYFNEDMTLCQQLITTHDTIEVSLQHTYASKAIGHLYTIRGQLDDALAILTTDRAQCAARVKRRGTPDDIALLVASITMQARVYYAQTAREEAHHALTDAILLARQLITFRGIATDHQSLGTTLSLMATVSYALGNTTQATACIDEALTIARQQVTEHDSPDRLRELSLALAAKGNDCRNYAAWHDALPYHIEELEVSQRLVAQRGTPDDQRSLCGAYIALAQTQAALGDRTNAYTTMQHAEKIAHHVHEQTPHIITADEVADIHTLTHQYHPDHSDTPPQSAPSHHDQNHDLHAPHPTPPAAANPWLITLIVLVALIIWRILQ